MKKKLIAFLILAFFGCKSIQKTDEKSAAIDILVGQKNIKDLQQTPYNVWFTPGFENYKPHPETIVQLRNYSNDFKIKIVMGTWCEDSQNQVPHFYKILKQIHFDLKKATLITVDRKKKTPDHLEKGLDITHVPTFIIYKNGKEIQRIVESPVETLEKDLLKIVSGQDYKHTYEN
jgi:thiol-disulfide isomerase/thioredoxin